MDIREVVRSSEFYALLAGAALSVLAYHNLMDPSEAKIWSAALFTYAGGRFVSKTAKASIPTAGGTK